MRGSRLRASEKMDLDCESFEKQCLSAVEQHHVEFASRYACVDVRAGGVLPSEMMLFVSLCLQQEVSRVFESGRCRGYSTEVLCQWPDRWIVRSCERSPMRAWDDVLLDRYQTLIVSKGRGELVLPRWVLDAEADHRIAVLLDGPKQGEALDLGRSLAPSVAFYGVHDLLDVPSGDACFSTRVPSWASRWGVLDDPSVEHGGYASRHEMTAQSMGLTVFPGGRWRGADSG